MMTRRGASPGGLTRRYCAWPWCAARGPLVERSTAPRYWYCGWWHRMLHTLVKR